MNIDTKDIENLIRKNPSCNFIINGHPLLWKNYDNSTRESNLFLKLEALEKRHNNIKFLPLIKNIDNINSIADFFIGDHSSFFIGACLADKPIVFFRHPGFIFQSRAVEGLFINASTCFSSSNELNTAFTQVLSSANSKNINRKHVVDYFLYQPGNVVNYIISSLKTMGRVSGPNSKSWYKVQNYCSTERKKLT